MPDRRSLLAAVAATLALSAAVTACGSSSSSSSEPDRPTTTVAASPSTSASGVETASSGDETSATGENPGVETLADGEAPADKTVTFTTAGSWDPESLEVAPGEVFTFVAAPDAGTVAVTFDGGDNTYTMSGGLTESFTLESPGPYTVSEDISGTEMTIEVTG